MLPGTPRDFVDTISSFKSRSLKLGGKSPSDAFERAYDVGKLWGIEQELWDRTWADLSGGESQRIALAVAVGLDAAEILLLDGKGNFF
jgi:ABC-type dipeptide/oligopeptide/nickel transport system ATPase subunit